ncbi:MAG TPA: DUF4157 domain-containing protein [Ktedonobacteraceae bacterium]|nr:DUF4157 domain-containing protein [Ktedonobacteraceae bacterium]
MDHHAKARQKRVTGHLPLSQSGENTEASFQWQQPTNENALSVVQEALEGGGQSLDTETRAFMEPQFGHDFSQVRIHTDQRAAESAQTVNALAYTVGRDVVFGQGQYAPQTHEGKKLLAHELAHVVQTSYTSSSGNMTLGEPGDSYEQEAERASTQIVQRTETPAAFASAAPAGNIQTNAPGNIVRRSLLGGILGGIVGGVAGAIGGFLIGGPIGAVVGGIGGFVGGALIGNALTTQSRGLTPEEITYAREIFRDSLDYSAIRITKHSMFSAGASRTIGNTINLEDEYYDGDTMNLTDSGKFTLIHEMGHVWQYQHGGLTYIPESLIAQFRASRGAGSRNAAYDWRAAITAGIPWERWNPEQQAEAIEEYNIALRKTRDGTATAQDYQDLATLEPYMQKVRNGEGAPGEDPPSTDTGTQPELQDAGLPGGL